MVHDLTTDEVEAFTLSKVKIIRKVNARIKELYPEAYQKLCDIYGDGDNDVQSYPRVNRFLKCNFSVYDNHPDIDDDWNFDLELVPCPLRGECKDEICNPKLTTTLSSREKEVIRLKVEGLTEEEIGDRLFISRATVHNHMTHIYTKLKITGSSCPETTLIKYAYKNKLV
jgi:DNA-binding NarL/FixJ family response regulator